MVKQFFIQDYNVSEIAINKFLKNEKKKQKQREYTTKQKYKNKIFFTQKN